MYICLYRCRSQWPRGLRRRSAAARLLKSWVRNPPGAWMFVCCECCVLSGRGLCDELITRPEESYLLWCVVVCDLENLKNKEAMTRVGSQRQKKENLDSCRSQWPRGLRRRSASARLLRSWVRIPPGAWMFVCCECWLLSGRGLCDELITRPEESYRLRCVVCDLENLKNEEAMTRVGSQRQKKENLDSYR